ncbi:MAG: tetratricopeptide repeat protein [Acidiferrobacterales bacterium]
MRRHRFVVVLLCLALSACLTTRHSAGPTIKSLKRQRVDAPPSAVAASGLERAIESYRDYLQSAGNDRLRLHATHRLADLEMEKAEADATGDVDRLGGEKRGESYPAARKLTSADYRSAIKLYNDLLRVYPDYRGNDRVLYQLAHAYEQSGDSRQSLQILDRLIAAHPDSKHIDEVQFRRGELLFVLKDYQAAENAYSAVLRKGEASPFYDKALYKHGWSLFKQLRYDAALDSFFVVLDRRLTDRATGQIVAERQHLTRGERELLDDTLRVLSVSFSYLDGEKTISRYLAHKGGRPYAFQVYATLGDLYLKQERYVDAANAYGEFVRQHASDARAPSLQLKVMEAYKQGRFPSLVLQAKEEFVRRYGVASNFWALHDPQTRATVVPHLKANIEELARHYHAQAQRSKRQDDYLAAAHWYTEYVRAFPDDRRAPALNFLLAELLFEGKRYAQAAVAYERTAYEYPAHKHSAEAGYAAILAHQKHEVALKSGERAAYRQQVVTSALRFADAFPQEPRAPAVLTKAAEQLFELKEFDQAAAAAQRVTTMQPPPAMPLRRTAWTVVAHTEFEKGAYPQAEQAYREVLRLTATGDRKRSALTEQLAASVYKQGEQRRAAGDLRAAVTHFTRVKEVAPRSSIAATAEYDAAAGLMSLKDWSNAITVLERFHKRYPKHPLQREVPKKLAVAYMESGQWSRAAAQFEAIAGLKTDPRVRREALWQAAELYDKAQQRRAAASAYARYVRLFPQPFERAMEARHRVAQAYGTGGQKAKQHRWLAEIIKAADANSGKQTERTRYLTAQAAFLLAEPTYEQFRRVRLVIPLKQSLRRKKRNLQAALRAYTRAVDYGVAEFTTAATYRIAELYHTLGRDLLSSQRPKGLSTQELEQYNVLLEEQAYPFEEKAIEIHEANVQRVADDIYDDWVQKSFTALSKLRPVRYAKLERSEHVSTAIR